MTAGSPLKTIRVRFGIRALIVFLTLVCVVCGALAWSRQVQVRHTGRMLDLHIDGEGYFVLLMPDMSRAYTRNGTFFLDREGHLVTIEGYFVAGGVNSLPSWVRSLSVGVDGTILIDPPSEIDLSLYGWTDTAIDGLRMRGQFQLAMFPNPAGLGMGPHGYWLETPQSGRPLESVAGDSGIGVVRQGVVEIPNHAWLLRFLRPWKQVPKESQQVYVRVRGCDSH